MSSCIIVTPRFKVLETWVPEYINAFAGLGYKASAIRISENYTSELKAALREDCRFILTFDGHGIGDEMFGFNLYERLKFPLISLYLDHAEFMYEPLTNAPPGSWSGFYDRHDITYAKKYLNSPSNYFFLTDAGLFGPHTPVPTFGERDIDIMFCGYIYDPAPVLSFWQGFSNPRLTDLFKSMSDMLLTDERITPADAFELHMRQNDIFFDNVYDPKISRFHDIMTAMSTYGRGMRRLNFLKSLLASGIRIHYFGYADQFAMLDSPNAVYGGLLYGDEYFSALRRAKITLNTLPLSQYALSERIPTAMLNGALTVSDTNPYMDLFFKDGRDLIAYKHSDYSALPDRINEVLNNRGKWEEMTYNAYTVASGNHTFLHRAQEILDVIRKDF